MREDTIHKDYKKLHAISRNARVLSGIASLLDWDQETHMPPGGSDIRGDQLKTLAGIIHREKTSRKFSNVLAKLIDLKTGNIIAKGISERQKASLQCWRRDYLKALALPTKFVENFAKLSSESIHAWKHARETNTFKDFAPYLKKIIDMKRKKADLIGYKEHPYDALIDDYEPEMTTKEVAALFSLVKPSAKALVNSISAKAPINDCFLHGNFSKQKQIEFGLALLDTIGYSANHGRVDISAHPFSSSSHPTDSRITTRIHHSSIVSNIMVLLHEGGHSLYEMGLPIEEYGSPLGDALSLGMHESQSRFWETRIGLSQPFWKYLLPLLKETFKGKFDGITVDQFYRAVNKVEPSYIRVEADEVTYPLHIILRFEMEKGLIEGTIAVKDIPEVWNSKMVDLLGIEPKNDTEGCLQDIHWAMGAFGYFPTYTLGNMYAAHLFNQFEVDYPDWERRVSLGEFSFIKEWLRNKIHQHGRHYNSKELLKLATKKTFKADAYIEYLNKKYGEIYSCSLKGR